MAKAGRPSRQTVEYFSHDCHHTKSMEILEGKFGIAGYGVWFKLLESLGSTEGHFLDFSDEIIFQHFCASKCHISGTEITAMLDLAARIGMIDKDLWASKVVWCQHFVDRLSTVYGKRKAVSLPEKPYLRNVNPISDPQIGMENDVDGISGDLVTEREVKRSKEKRSKEYVLPHLGSFQNVKLTEDETNKLHEKFQDADTRIERLSKYLASKGDKYKSHYATILNWAEKDGGGNGKPGRTPQPERFTEKHYVGDDPEKLTFSKGGGM